MVHPMRIALRPKICSSAVTLCGRVRALASGVSGYYKGNDRDVGKRQDELAPKSQPTKMQDDSTQNEIGFKLSVILVQRDITKLVCASHHSFAQVDSIMPS